jgi:hypothetical protein
MVDKYIDGIIKEAIARANALKTKIPGAAELDVYFEALATKADREISDIISNLQDLMNDNRLKQSTALRQKILFFKQINRNLSLLETIVVAALTRYHADDVYVNKLVSTICKEIKYPIAKPVASCLSQDYYHIYPDYNLLCVPLLESDFLLHIPDLYHELAHPLISIDNPKTKKFQEELGKFNTTIKAHFDNNIEKEEKTTNRADFISSLFIWRDSWIEGWSTEFFCDLFGIYTLGPAFAWSHLHLTIKTCSNVFNCPDDIASSHPPDDARIRAMIHGLNLIGYSAESKLIEANWNSFVKVVEHEKKKKGRYDYAIPSQFLEMVAISALNGTKGIGCNISTQSRTDKIHSLLNNAWEVFWQNIDTFSTWEEAEVLKLKNILK